MIKSKVALIGYGYVGKGMHKIFPDAILYDIDKGSKDEVNQNAELAIVCVPTPIAEDGSCDASIVEEAVCWPICFRQRSKRRRRCFEKPSISTGNISDI